MNQRIIISVIVPVYNAENTIVKCFEALEKQTMKNIEVIYIDDGSTDNSYNILKKLCKSAKTSKVVSQTNGGPSKARNTGIVMAGGEFLMFCDSDDIVEANWCEKLYKVFQKEKCLTICHMARENSEGIIQWSTLEQYWPIRNRSVEMIAISKINLLYKAQLLNSPCNKLYKSSVIKENNIKFVENLNLGEDLIFNIRYIVCAKEKYVSVVNEVLYRYIMINEESLTQKYRDDYIENQHIIFEKLIYFFEKCEIEDEAFFRELYYDYFFLLYNYFSEYICNNQHSFIYKANYLTQILKNDTLLNKAYEICSFEQDSKIFVKVIQCKNYYIIWLFEKCWRIIEWLRGK